MVVAVGFVVNSVVKFAVMFVVDVVVDAVGVVVVVAVVVGFVVVVMPVVLVVMVVVVGGHLSFPSFHRFLEHEGARGRLEGQLVEEVDWESLGACFASSRLHSTAS